MTLQRRRITAFGSSRISVDDPCFQDVEILSKKLAEHNWDGQTGGHQGMMAAFSQGIRAGGGHVRGITLECFPTPPNNSFSEEVRAHDFFSRMQHLIEDCDAWLVLPGGLGTLSELAMSWDLRAINILQNRPLILYGDMWPSIIATLQDSLMMSVDHGFDMLTLCSNHDDVLNALKAP
ncbi:MAG: LOG family protein [Mariprofundaceae bacterium]|nr:LOG family protein [Mariprofundaceae bacterium]